MTLLMVGDNTPRSQAIFRAMLCVKKSAHNIETRFALILDQ